MYYCSYLEQPLILGYSQKFKNNLQLSRTIMSFLNSSTLSEKLQKNFNAIFVIPPVLASL